MLQAKSTWLLLLLLSHSTAVHSLPSPGDPASVAGKARDIMEPLVATNNYAGNLMIVKDGRVEVSASYGMRDEENRRANTRDTKFFLCSASMIFTSAAIMKLVDEGRLSTADRLSGFFPDFERGDDITVHHMLAQRSGIPAWDAGLSLANLNRNEPHTPAELIEYFKNDELLFEPGSDYAHGRSEYILLAAIIEEVSGQPFGEYLREAIFEPLDMRDSGHFSHEMAADDIAALAQGYEAEGFFEVAPAPKIHWSVKTGHASIYSTVDDLRKFADAVLQGKLLSRASWNAVLTDHGSRAGYGWFIDSQIGHRRYQMNGRSPGFSSYFGIYPDDDLVVIMLSNRYVSLPYFVGPELASAALGEDYETLRLSAQDVDEDLAGRIAGHYKMGPDFYRPNGITKIVYRNGKMYSGSFPLIPVIDEAGTITAFVHRHYWSRLEFVTGENGQTVLRFDGMEGHKRGPISRWQAVAIATGVVVALLLFAWKGKVAARRPQP